MAKPKIGSLYLTTYDMYFTSHGRLLDPNDFLITSRLYSETFEKKKSGVVALLFKITGPNRNDNAQLTYCYHFLVEDKIYYIWLEILRDGLSPKTSHFSVFEQYFELPQGFK